MKWMKRTALALAAGAALSLTAVASGSAAPVGQTAAIATGAIAQSDGNVIDVRRHWRGRGWHGRRHGWHRHRHRGFRGWWVPFAAAPLLYGGYSYSNSCYRECRYYYGPRYCRYNWRRYC